MKRFVIFLSIVLLILLGIGIFMLTASLPLVLPITLFLIALFVLFLLLLVIFFLLGLLIGKGSKPCHVDTVCFKIDSHSHTDCCHKDCRPDQCDSCGDICNEGCDKNRPEC